MSGWKETAALADECARATVSLISECNRQKIAEMLAHEATKKELGHALLRLQQERDAKDEWRQECVEERAAHEATQELLLQARQDASQWQEGHQSACDLLADSSLENHRLRAENDLCRQLLQVAVLMLPADEETEILRKRICALGGRRA